ncbi:MAG: cation transporter [endosymbiont of Galathealinum brachiosum]|uniref:Cation transporter n=1 Tax=endosymbiont of Galathealinum brachiosum TaxID=2200906 RepID=A0A370DK46_9GAMM|nr:MAG: cation transporter [endosymbiont of Galathealinum brachiosum]
MKDSAQRDKQVRRIILIEGLANLLVLICKITVGLSTGSMAILADAIHSLTDLINNVVAWFVIHFSSLPADREHPYGHRKFETLTVFVLGSILVLLAFELALSAIKNEESEVVSSDIEIVIMLGVLVINILVTSWQHMWAKRLNSDILRADATHTFADVLITSVVIAGWQLSVMGYVWVDRLCAFGVAILVIYLAYKLFKRAVPVLLDEYAIDPDELSCIIKKVHGVKKVYRIRSRWIGNACAVDMVISVDPSLSTEESHSIADKIESLIEKEFDTSDISIHVEPDI